MPVHSLLIRTVLGIVLVGLILIAILQFDLLPKRVIPQHSLSGRSAVLTVDLLTAKLAANQINSLKADPISAGLPVRLNIPAIHLDAAIEYVGLAADGAMDVPKSQQDVAWFEPGKRPGENGSAVIAGHYGWVNNIPSAFDQLYQLQTGDKLYIKDDQGIITTFVVRETRTYDPNADASEVFKSADGIAHLNLITCEGVWNERQQSYSKRLVVFADKE